MNTTNKNIRLVFLILVLGIVFISGCTEQKFTKDNIQGFSLYWQEEGANWDWICQQCKETGNYDIEYALHYKVDIVLPENWEEKEVKCKFYYKDEIIPDDGLGYVFENGTKDFYFGRSFPCNQYITMEFCCEGVCRTDTTSPRCK